MLYLGILADQGKGLAALPNLLLKLQHNTDSWAAKYGGIRRRQVSSSPMSAPGVRLVQTWIETCIDDNNERGVKSANSCN